MRIDPRKILDGFGLDGDEVQRVRLGPGVVGNTSTAIVFTVMALAAEAFALKNQPAVMFGVMAVTLILTMTYLIGTWIFASKYPDLALMGGAELLQLRHLQMAARSPEIMSDKTLAKAPTVESSSVSSVEAGDE